MQIRHEPETQRFLAENGQSKGVLEYQRIDDKTLDYRHTFVLEQFRGKGVATRLVRCALGHALATDAKVIPSCPFVATVMESEPAFRELRAPRAGARDEEEGVRQLRYAVQAPRVRTGT